MSETLKLSKSVDINGESVCELQYDFEGLTAQDLMNASKNYQKSGGVMQVQELDSNYHLFIFAEAVKKIDQSIETSDLMRLGAKDAIAAESLVRNFFFLDLADTSQSDTSGTQLLN